MPPATKQRVQKPGGGKGARPGGRNDDAPRDRWFNPNMDEDIDDELAFDSDDEKKYGSFFQNQPAAKGAKKGSTKKGGAGGAEEHGDDEDFDDLANSEGGFSDDSRDEIDISELLDTKEERKAAMADRRTQRGGDASTAATLAGKKSAKGAAAGRRRVDDAESMLLAPGSRRSALDMSELTAAASKSSAAVGSVKERLEKLRSTQGLIGRELTEEERDLMDRALARDATKADMKKWQDFIKDQRKARSISFPLKAPRRGRTPATRRTMTPLPWRPRQSRPPHRRTSSRWPRG
jgi:U3 small nucleolar RNA-associated protein 14